MISEPGTGMGVVAAAPVLASEKFRAGRGLICLDSWFYRGLHGCVIQFNLERLDYQAFQVWHRPPSQGKRLYSPALLQPACTPWK